MHDDGPCISVVNYSHVYIVHARVVVKVAVGPPTAVIAGADITETVVDAAIETDLRSPVARVPEVRAVSPTPIAGRPEKADLWRFDPGAGNPEISSVIAVAPVAGRPEVAV